MSQESSEPDPSDRESAAGDGLGITDDQLPEDLQPTDDNPLAQPAADEVPDDLLVETSRTPDSGGDSGRDSGANSGDASPPGEDGASDTSPSGEASSETETETETGGASAEGPGDSSDD